MAPASVLFGVIATFASGALASCAHGTFLQPRAEGEIKAPTFGYAGAIGPANWVSIDAAANQACASGTRQSPIDMTSDVFTMVPGTELDITIPDLEAGAEFENLGTTVEVIAEGGTIKVSDTTFTLQQFHFHLPSEHLDNGTSRAMEMHMVWQSEAEELAVIGVYVDIAGAAAAAKAKGRRRYKAKGVTTKATTASTLLETVLGTVDQIPTLGNTITTEPLIMSELVTALSAGSFKAYSGSLTTPPCSEGVHWFVSTEVLTIESATFFKARDVIGFNARYAQNTPGEPNLVALAAASMA
ncbi:alpha carbonic anhydrase [Dactylonectria macrodidyma]|uniref:carbonic anhydrase n=1 Tax=Dactylonectria macrodidyma TaxID=307937 RepID=A0A9P9JFJ6_9HYPO|nr:alpha carbonic anhydrase [Dactylonectria macrodidyma]